MRPTLFVCLISMLLLCSTNAPAQEEEIVVTASRRSEYESDIVPVVHIRRRADFMVLELIVESDSRDAALRRDEVFKTLRALLGRTGRERGIELGVMRTLETDAAAVQFVEPFSNASIKNEILTAGSRVDTTRATIVAKTPISESDTFDGAYQRLEKFLDGAAKAGRATVLEGDDPGLSIVNIGQYRQPLLEMLATDNAAVRRIFGDDYRVSLSGLEKPVRWRVVGPLELAIYFPYQSQVAPR